METAPAACTQALPGSLAFYMWATAPIPGKGELERIRRHRSQFPHVFHGIANSMWSSGCEVVAAATAHVASVLGCPASSLVGRPRVLTTRTDVYAVFVDYHECNMRSTYPIRLSKGRYAARVQNPSASRISPGPERLQAVATLFREDVFPVALSRRVLGPDALKPEHLRRLRGPALG